MKNPNFLGIRNLMTDIAARLNEQVGYKFVTALAYHIHQDSALRVFSNSSVFPLDEVKPFSGGPSMRTVRTGVPILAKDRTEIEKRFPDSVRIFSLECGSLMNIPILIHEKTVGQVNLLHHDGFYTDHSLCDAQALITDALSGQGASHYGFEQRATSPEIRNA